MWRQSLNLLLDFRDKDIPTEIIGIAPEEVAEKLQPKHTKGEENVKIATLIVGSSIPLTVGCLCNG